MVLLVDFILRLRRRSERNQSCPRIRNSSMLPRAKLHGIGKRSSGCATNWPTSRRLTRNSNSSSPRPRLQRVDARRARRRRAERSQNSSWLLETTTPKQHEEKTRSESWPNASLYPRRSRRTSTSFKGKGFLQCAQSYRASLGQSTSLRSHLLPDPFFSSS